MNIAFSEKDVKTFSSQLFTETAAPVLPFHNLQRTTQVAEIAVVLGRFYHLADNELFLLETAAWLAFTGYTAEGRHGHKSSEIALNFVEGKGLNEAETSQLLALIEVANELKLPSGILEEIMYDAVTYYYGTDNFKELNKLRSKEYEMALGDAAKEKDWNSVALEKLQKHHYFTDYATNLLNETKKENLKRLRKKKQKKVEETLKAVEKGMKQEKADKTPGEGESSKPAKEKQPVRGIEMMFRVSSTNNIRVSIMADSKAHIMITVNSIIVSVLFGLTIKSIDTNPQFILPSIILLAVNITTIVYSVLATRPGHNIGTFTQEQVDNKSVNMLFYGSFYNMDFEDYKSAMKKVMTDSDFMYGCLMKDLYWQGKVLGRKYSLLRKAYTIFLYGLIISVAAFVIAGLFFS